MHPSDGTLRRALDESDAVDAANRRHMATCARCTERVQRMSANAGWVQAMLPVHDPVVDVSGARARLLRTEVAAGGVTRPHAGPLRTANRRASRVVAGVGIAAVASALLVVTGGAQDFLSLFQPSQLAAVSVTAADIRSLAGLASYGTVSGACCMSSTKTPWRRPAIAFRADFIAISRHPHPGARATGA